MNSVFISGLVKGEATAAKGDGVLRIVTTQDSKQNSKEFKVFAPAGDVAEKLKNIPSGKRIILDGRISGEELEVGSGIYQGVVSVRRVIAITDAMNGVDVATGTIGGAASCDALRFTGTGTAIANLNIKSTRTFTSKKDNKEVTATTYLNAVAWADKAQQLQPLIPMTDIQIAVSGMLVPSEYQSTKHGGATVSKIEVWADEFSVSGAASVAAPAPAAPSAPKPSRRTKGSDEEGLGF